MKQVVPVVILAFFVVGGAACRSAAPASWPPGGEVAAEPSTAQEDGDAVASEPLPSDDSATDAEEEASTAAQEEGSPVAADTAAAEEDEATGHQATQKEALELCQSAEELLKGGETAEAMAAVDHAYQLMLTLPNNGDEAYLQAKDDIRQLAADLIRRAHRPAGLPASPARSWDLALPIVNNEHVQREIKSFTNGERKFFIESYQRSGLYRPMILAKLKEAGLPSQLSWLPLVESGFKVRAYSRASAVGLWQFIASTGQRYGLSRDGWVDERRDPEKSTDAALAYLMDLHALFGDWPKALAAYNCGEARVARASRRKANEYQDFWDLYSRLPFETSRYIPRFFAALLIIQDPERYGMRLPEPYSPNPTIVTVRTARAVKLEKLDRALSLPKNTLSALNPELRSGATPPRAYDLQVPRSVQDAVPAAVASLPVWKQPRYLIHRVRRGETLSQIARRYHTSMRAIKVASRLRSIHRLRIGQRLRIPVRGR